MFNVPCSSFFKKSANQALSSGCRQETAIFSREFFKKTCYFKNALYLCLELV